MKIIICTLVALSLFGCTAIKMTPDGGHVRYMSEIDGPDCEYISNVSASTSTFFREILSMGWTPDADFEAVFNDAMNNVASAGGNAYTIVTLDETGSLFYEITAWRCKWASDQYVFNNRKTSSVQEISVNDRRQCTFIRSIPEASNLGVTQSRDVEGARKDAIKHVQELGGNSYYVVNEAYAKGTAALIIEAWHCD